MERISPTASYRDLHASFRWDVPPHFNFGADVIDAWARDPGRLALIWANDKGEERRLTFRDVSRLSNRLANHLRARGVAKGDRVVVMLPRIPEWQIALIGCLKIGAVPIPCVTMLTRKDLDYRIGHSGAVAAITTADNVAKFADGPAVRIGTSNT